MVQLCWNVVTNVFDSALSQLVNKRGDAPQRALANKRHCKGKGRMREYSSCHATLLLLLSLMLGSHPCNPSSDEFWPSINPHTGCCALLAFAGLDPGHIQSSSAAFAVCSGSITDSKRLWKLWSRACFLFNICLMQTKVGRQPPEGFFQDAVCKGGQGKGG